MKLSLALIVHNSHDDIQRAKTAIKSVEQHVDEVCILLNGQGKPLDTFSDYNMEYFEHPKDWKLDFAELRTKNFAQCKGEWILWIDSDDILEGGEHLAELITLAEMQKADGFAFQYFYEQDENGNFTDIHWKVQLLRNDGHFQWKGAIHEDPIQVRQAKWYQTDKVRRIHKTSRERSLASHYRNLEVLERLRKDEPNEPRHLFYLGRAYIATSDFENAREALTKYLELSGWDDERYEARLLIGQTYLSEQQYDKAIKEYNEAILEKELFPDAYIQKGMCYLKTGEYAKALKNFELSFKFDAPTGGTYYNPMLYTRDVYAGATVCYINLAKFTEASRALNKALSYDPKSVYLNDLKELVNQLKTKNDLANNYFSIIQYLRAHAPDNLPALLSSVPQILADDPRILAAEFAVQEPKKWSDKSLVIYCGNTVERFLAEDVNGKGLGGSETAVVELGKRLAKLGWEVTVFNRCDAPSEGITQEGITFKNFWQINKRDEFNVLWIWRTPGLLDYDWNAKKVVVDLHDVVSPAEWTADRIKKVDKVFVKTDYHKSLYPMIPAEKFAVIGNGIDLSRFKGKMEKEPYRFVYASTPDRGLDVLLEHIWPRIKAQLPKAELHLYYGWKTFYELEKNNPERMKWMKKVQKLTEQPGVVNHGRVGQKELAKDLLKTSYWLYPTDFPEIHCITACEMQAAGVYSITTGFAALEETQQSGIKLEGDIHDPSWQQKYVEAVVKAVDSDIDRAEIQKVAQQFTWDDVATEWDKELK